MPWRVILCFIWQLPSVYVLNYAATNVGMLGTR
jgi:hypothetical protein